LSITAVDGILIRRRVMGPSPKQEITPQIPIGPLEGHAIASVVGDWQVSAIWYSTLANPDKRRIQVLVGHKDEELQPDDELFFEDVGSLNRFLHTLGSGGVPSELFERPGLALEFLRHSHRALSASEILEYGKQLSDAIETSAQESSQASLRGETLRLLLEALESKV
jgi:hypothetical protein